MLDEYFDGTLPQLVARGRLLKGKIPRDLPRDYDGLIQACDLELDGIIAKLRELQEPAGAGGVALQHARLRKFRRAVADLDHIETTGIAVLNRAHDDDHHANRLLYRICREISYPWITPTVTTLSTGYFYIYTKLNLMFIPPAEGSFLLHLPDLYHELAHPLLTPRNNPVLDRLLACYLQCTARVHDYFAEKRETEDIRRGPQAFKDSMDRWEILWTKYWLVEFFCDLFAVATLGPAFAWAHLHLFMKTGSDAFSVPSGVRIVTHPADDARMRAVLASLRKTGFDEAADAITARWNEALRLSDNAKGSDYAHCYPDELIDCAVVKALEGVEAMECRIARPDTKDPVYALLNEAWDRFWAYPDSYHQWESDAVKALFRHCENGTASITLRGAISAGIAE